jgi:ABC-type sugar transport system ATPase subunit
MSSTDVLVRSIECRGLKKSFGAVRALDGVDLALNPGQVHGLLGANGAGKSTLLKILNGVYPYGSYEGDIFVGGQPAQFKRPHDALVAGLGYVPQELNVLEALTVAENIFVGRLTEGGGPVVSRRKVIERATQLLSRWGIPLKANRQVSSLSVSERQLVMIARGLSETPNTLVLDEPTSSLTGEEASTLFEIVKTLAANDVTVMFISHRMPEIFEICEDVTILRNGATVASYSRDEFDEAQMVQDMIGRRIDKMFPPRRPAQEGREALRLEQLNVPDPLVHGRDAVKDVSLSVRYGEIFGIAGLMGAGRTELLSAIYGRAPYSGTIFRDGVEVKIRSPKVAKRADIALLTEDRKNEGVLFNLAVGGNVSVASLERISKRGILSRSREEGQVSEFVKRLAIKVPSQRTTMDKLSGGNQQKVIFARVLMTNPHVILLDEPTKGIDVGTKEEIYRLILSLAEAGAAVLLVSSEFEELLGLCDRIAILREGNLVATVEGDSADEEMLVAACSGGEIPS